MPASKPIKELRRKAADLIIDRIKHPSPGQGHVTVTEAAVALQISRQAVYDILKRRYCPSLSLVHRACEAWGLKFDFRGLLVEKAIFSDPATRTVPSNASPQMELRLVEAIQQIDYRHFEVIEAKPAGREVTITLRLTIPA